MPTFEAAAEFACPPSDLFDFLLQPANILRVSPPELNARLVEGPERAELGSRITIEARNLGMRHRLSVVIVALEPNQLLADEQVEGPFRKYRHERRLTATPGGVLLAEKIDFEPPGGMLGLLLSAERLERYVAEAHAYRVKAITSLLSAAPES